MEAKKEIYQEKAKARYDQMSAKVDELIARFNETKADAKMKVKNQFEDLNDRRSTLEHKFDEFKDAGENAWQDMRSGLESAFDDLETSFDQATDKLESIS